MVNLDFALQVSGTYDDVLAAARWAEANGIVAVALPDHYLMGRGDDVGSTPAPDALIHLAGLARETSRIGLSVLVSPVTFRHPAVLYKSAVTIDIMSGGRFALGLGTGWLDREHEVFGFPYPPMADRYDLLEEALGYVRAALDPKPTAFEGRHFRLEAIPLAPEPVGRVPIIIGGTGAKKTPYLAGRYGDEYNCYPAPPEEFAARLGVARQAATDAGRDPEGLLISSSGQVLAARTEEGFRQKLEEVAARSGTSADELEAHYEMRNTPRGTFAQIRDQLAGYADAGVRRFYLQVGRFDRATVEELLEGLQG